MLKEEKFEEIFRKRCRRKTILRHLGSDHALSGCWVDRLNIGRLVLEIEINPSDCSIWIRIRFTSVIGWICLILLGSNEIRVSHQKQLLSMGSKPALYLCSYIHQWLLHERQPPIETLAQSICLINAKASDVNLS